jgi:hypothetical protein
MYRPTPFGLPYYGGSGALHILNNNEEPGFPSNRGDFLIAGKQLF